MLGLTLTVTGTTASAGTQQPFGDRSQGNGYVWEERLDNGYEHARLIAGHRGNGRFVEVNDLDDPTWANARLIG
ncbi:hypothetical protein [Nonomuraea typhae]|uniref:hypothetical protein n=1 Tax=Nonomuraea typhae TaxID=2603600 RepID=UPI0012FBF67B|nr:hypothetical protein [Nonomuraea typhae]